MAASAASEVSEGPVLSLMTKRLRNLKKKYNRIIQMEESIAQGKTINKEQEEVLRSKPAVVVLIEEYEKLRQPLSSALEEELNLALQHQQVSPAPPAVDNTTKDTKDGKDESSEPQERSSHGGDDTSVEDLLKLLYFGCLFDVKLQSDFTSTMLTRTHERGCCLTYDYVTDEATDLLGERDLDLISMLGSLVISRPLHSGLSHKNALRSCVEHAKRWLANSDQPIEAGAAITYAGLRERLNKILASDYFTTTPEMKAPVEVVAAAGKYVPCQVPMQDSPVPIQVEGAYTHYQQKDEEPANFEGQETGDDQSSPVEDESELANTVEVTSDPQQQKAQGDVDDQNQREVELKEQQYIPRRTYQNQRGNRGGVGGRRGYGNGRGGRSGRGAVGYPNGQNQFYEQQPGNNYYSRNYYNNSRGRGARGSGGQTYNNHGSATHASHNQADVDLGS
ncbi:uncharacterized protein LOC122671703 isoform X2 [Telopea speciosissima]|uniref:uncharacterized protein LOC122671703 isoform X2 n=1 Tax=Telopea speciosissima TaxID=54955 RepID=UPI001CC7E1E8|nr:uncharacterized protein LOC122671703 isoform X2 [Telopea speciosissima]